MKRGTLKFRLLAVLLMLCLLTSLAPVYAVSVGDLLEGHEIKAIQADTDGVNHFEYTPDESGYYFFATHAEEPEFMPCNHADIGATAATDYFNFDAEDSRGKVYKLTEDVKYCFAADNQDRHDFILNIKKVEVAPDFSVPATLEGTVGQVLPVDIRFDDDKALQTDPAVVGSNTNANGDQIVELRGGTARVEHVALLAEGTVTIEFTSPNLPNDVATCVITVKAAETILENETKTVSLRGGESVTYSFTPNTPGTYTMYVPSNYENYPAEFHVEGVAWDMWQANDRRGAAAFNLQAGQIYSWTVSANWDMTNCPVTLVKADAMTGLTMQETEKTTYVGSEVTIEAIHTPVYGVDREITWTSDNTAFAKVEATSLTSCNVRGISKGTANITASWTDANGKAQTATCKVTVMETTPLTLDQPEALSLKSGESTAFSFTAGSGSGEYLFKIPAGPSFSFEFNGPFYKHVGLHTDEFAGFVFGIHPNETVIMVITAEEDMTNSSMTVTTTSPATDINFTDGNATVTAIEGTANDSVRIYLDMVDGDYIADRRITVQDPSVARVEFENDGGFEVVFTQEGTTTITVDAADGIHKDLTVTTKAYGANIADKWVGTNQTPENVEFKYTPAHDGFYYIHYGPEMPRVIPVWGEAEPVSDFDYDDGNYCGTVFELTGGVTYSFMTEEPLEGSYGIYLVEVQKATSFTVPATMTGMVDEELWLDVSYSGVMAPKYTSTNEDVVRVGGSNAHGANIYPIAEGTADIIVTDQDGNQQKCTVTVSGKMPMVSFDGWKEMGLAAGKSVTYTYTPKTTGLYWINSELDHRLGISLTDNGAAVNHEFEYSQEDKYGKIYELTAGTQYLLTFSSDHSMSTFINSEPVEEATDIILYTNEVGCFEGERFDIPLGMVGSGNFRPVANLTVKSSDESVVKVVSGMTLEAVGSGTAQVSITYKGKTQTVSVEVEGYEKLAANEAVKKTFDPEQVEYWTFTPTEDDHKYTFTISGDNGMVFGIYDSVSGDELYYNELAEATTDIFDLALQKGVKYMIGIGNISANEQLNVSLQVGPKHSMTKTAAVAATCTAAGNSEYYTCSVCEGVFADAAGKTATTEEKVTVAAKGHDMTKTAAVAATCTAAGNSEYYTCSVCEGMFADAAGKTATTEEKVIITAEGHSLTKVEAVAPSYTAGGNTEHYACACGTLFADADGKTATTAEAVKLAQLVEVKQETAVVTPNAVDQAIEAAGTTGEVTIDVTKTESKVAKVELPVASLETLVKAEKPLTVVTEQATVVLDVDTLAAVAKAADGAEVTLRVEQVETKTLNKKQQEAIQDHDVLVTISANIYSGDQYIGDFKGGKATVKVPLKLEKGEDGNDYTVFYVDDEGNLEPVECYFKNGDMYFVTGHFSEYIIAKAPVEEKPVEEKDPTVPETGDNANLGLMTAVMVISLMGIAFVAVYGKKYAYTGKWER